MVTSSNTLNINALGIFGRLEPKQEDYFKQLQEKYSQFPNDDDTADIFRHLTLVLNYQVPIGKLSEYLDLLRILKPHLPLRLNVSEVIVVNDQDIALAFEIQQTQFIRDIANKFLSDGIINTQYTKVVRFVPKQYQEEVVKILKETEEMCFNDFVLYANTIDDAGTIYSSNRYK